jgi:hypothetical protein
MVQGRYLEVERDKEIGSAPYVMGRKTRYTFF